MYLTPFSSLGGQNGQKKKFLSMETGIAADGGGHLLRTNTLLLCLGMCKRLSFVLIWPAWPKVLRSPKDGFYLGTERTAMTSLLPFRFPFRSVPQGRIELRHVFSVGVRLMNESNCGLLERLVPAVSLASNFSKTRTTYHST